MKTCHPTHGVTMNDACDNLKVYTLDWNPDKLQMFLENEQNPFEQRVLLWEKGGHGRKNPFLYPPSISLECCLGLLIKISSSF